MEAGPGRNTLLTQEMFNAIVELVAVGNYRAVAAGAAGASNRSFTRWCKEGRDDIEAGKEDTLHARFWLAILKAEKVAESVAVKRVELAARVDVNHCWKWLERKYPHRWGVNRNEFRDLAAMVAELLDDKRKREGES
jgi:hypothetical protein